jgi:hypothetical protein
MPVHLKAYISLGLHLKNVGLKDRYLFPFESKMYKTHFFLTIFRGVRQTLNMDKKIDGLQLFYGA